MGLGDRQHTFFRDTRGDAPGTEVRRHTQACTQTHADALPPPHTGKDTNADTCHTFSLRTFLVLRKGDQTHILSRKAAGPKHTLLSDSHTPCRLNSWKQPQKNTPTPPPWNVQNYSTGNLPRCSGDPHPDPCEVMPQPRAHLQPRSPQTAGLRAILPTALAHPGLQTGPNLPYSLQTHRDIRVLTQVPPEACRTQNPQLSAGYETRCHEFCVWLYPCRVCLLATIPSTIPFLPRGSGSLLLWPGGLPWGRGVTRGLPSPFISLCPNQPSFSLFSSSHFPVTLLSNNFHVQFHFFSSSKTSKLSARG